MGKKKPKVFTVHGLRLHKIEKGRLIPLGLRLYWKLTRLDRPGLEVAEGSLDGISRLDAYINAAKEMVRLAKIELAADVAFNARRRHREAAKRRRKA